MDYWVVVSNIFYFHPENWGFMIQFDEHIFQAGWFNHQPGFREIINFDRNHLAFRRTKNDRQKKGLRGSCPFSGWVFKHH